ncbi:MAG: hypothetical protein V4662_09170 [Verrucomicrobiota bacterium]
MKSIFSLLATAFLLMSALSSAQAATWTHETTAAVTAGRTIQDIWGASDSAVWAVGGTASTTELWKWNGSTWATQSTGATANHAAAWGVDASNVWIVGRGGRIDKTTNGGANWTQQASGLPSTALIRGIWGSSASDVWAVAGDTGDNTIVYIIHFNGIAWSTYSQSFSGGLRSIWGTAANDIWAVGDLGNRLHYDGNSWTSVPGLPSIGLFRVWGLDASNIWIIADNATIVKHTGGLTWAPFNNTGITGTNQLRGITGSSATNLYVATGNGLQNMYHFDGTSWALETTNTPNNNTLVSLWSTNNATKLWAGGSPVVISGTAAAQAAAPTVTTPTHASVTHNNATLGGNVTSDNASTITARGVVLAKTADDATPMIGEANVSNQVTAGTTGVFSLSVGSLSPSTAYTYAAYATNGIGTTYTSTSTFTTSAPPGVAVTSLVRAGATPTNASTVSWSLTFASAVTGATSTNFSVSGAGATGTSIGTPTTSDAGLHWTIPVTTNVDGLLTLSLQNSTGLSSAVSTTLPYAGESYTIDKSPPTVLTVTRLTPAGQTTNLTTVVFRVTYSEPVTLNAPESGHFVVMPVGASTIVGSVTGVTGTGATRDVTVNLTGGLGEFRLRVLD